MTDRKEIVVRERDGPCQQREQNQWKKWPTEAQGRKDKWMDK